MNILYTPISINGALKKVQATHSTIPLYILTFTLAINTSDVMMVIHDFQNYIFIPHDSSHFTSVHL